MILRPHQRLAQRASLLLAAVAVLGGARAQTAYELQELNTTLQVAAQKIQALESQLAAAVKDSLHAVTKMHGQVELVQPGTLPNDGKVIEDARKYD